LEVSKFGQKGVVEGTVVYSSEPSELFSLGKGENRTSGNLLNKAISILIYDQGG
jgi:hypothetical protein